MTTRRQNTSNQNGGAGQAGSSQSTGLNYQQTLEYMGIIMDSCAHEDRLTILKEVLGKDSEHSQMFNNIEPLLRDKKGGKDAYATNRNVLLNALTGTVFADASKKDKMQDLVDAINERKAQKNLADKGFLKSTKNVLLGTGKSIATFAAFALSDMLFDTSYCRTIIGSKTIGAFTGIPYKDIVMAQLGVGALGNRLQSQGYNL